MSFLQKRYLRDDFLRFLNDDFLPDFVADNRPVRVHDKSLLKNVQKLGDSNSTGVSIFEAICDDSDHGKRVAITQDAFRVLRDTATRNALVVFYSEKSSNWRLSLLTSSFDLDNKGKVITKLSNPKRYSYLLGPDAKTVTPYKYLVSTGKVNDFDDLRQRFSVEVVNKEFYSSVAELYTKLVGGKRKNGAKLLEFPGLLKIHGQVNQSVIHQEFAVRLIGRLVFCWFLREKKSDKGTSLIPDVLLSAASAKTAMYYHQVLEPLFFEILNKKLKDRKQPFKEAPYSQVPYLNGGLFSPQSGEGGDYYRYSEATNGGHFGVVDVPDNWLQEFTELLDRYNFTVDENTSLNIDLSVDPEMLGRIFENLLAEINPETGESARKSTGSFYTPRSIVEYMVDKSLAYYLDSKTSLGLQKIEALISYDEIDDLEYPLSSHEEISVIDALSSLSTLDPACGSGAFPIGMLQKIVFILQKTDKDAKYWLEKQLGAVTPELRRHLEQQYENKNYDYLRKLGIIRESIYGVDIQPIATEIARLRCFLTLIVEEKVDDDAPNRGIEPLPNLDFKFVSANSLEKLPKSKKSSSTNQQEIFEDTTHIKELRDIRDRYFGASNHERLELQMQFSGLQKKMALKNIDEYKGSASKLYDTLTRWEPFEHKTVNWFDPEWMFGLSKFDVVISNPPWGAKLSKPEKSSLKELYPSIDSSTPNSFAYFLGLAEEIKPEVLTYVLPDSIMTKDYSKTRALIKNDLCNLNWYQNTGVPEKFRPFVYVEHDVCVLISKKGQGDLVNYCRYDYKSMAITKKAWQTSKEKTIRPNFENVFNLLADDNDYKILDKLSLHEPLSNKLQCHEGIHTGNSRDLLFSKEKRGNAKPLFYGGSAGDVIDNFVSRTSGWFVDYRPGVINKDLGYYASLRDERIFSNPKLYVTRTGNPFKVFIDTDTYASNNFFSIQFKDYSYNSIEELQLILPFLLSKVAQYFIRTFAAPRIGSTFIETKIIHLLKLPVPQLRDEQRLRMLELVSLAIESRKNDSNMELGKFNDEINGFVYELYNLTPEEVQLIEETTK